MSTRRADIEKAYREIRLHRDGDRAKAISAWDVALKRFRGDVAFALTHYDLYLEGLKMLREMCASSDWEQSADSLTAAELFKAELEARRREKG